MTATFHPASDFQRRHSGEWTHRHDTSPDYTVRRAVAVVLVIVVMAAAAVAFTRIAGAVADLGGRPAAASEVPGGSSAAAPLVRAVHVASPGESLWTIADQHRGDVGRDRYVDALIALNGGTVIQVGQAVELP